MSSDLKLLILRMDICGQRGLLLTTQVPWPQTGLVSQEELNKSLIDTRKHVLEPDMEFGTNLTQIFFFFIICLTQKYVSYNKITFTYVRNKFHVCLELAPGSLSRLVIFGKPAIMKENQSLYQKLKEEYLPIYFIIEEPYLVIEQKQITFSWNLYFESNSM